MRGKESLSFLPPPGSSARVFTFILWALVPLLLGVLALFLGQDTNWDLRNYHWYNGYALVNGRFGFDLLPSQTPYFYNPLLDVPFFLLASHVPAKVAGFLLAMVQGLNFVCLFLLAHATLVIEKPPLKVWICALLATLGMLGGGGIAQIGTTFYDNITSLGVFLSALLVIRSFPDLLSASWKKALALAILCGFPAGLMMGLKLPSVIFCVGLCGALLLVAGSWQRRLGIAFGFGLGVLLGLALSLGPWAFYLHEQYGNPLFPYFNNIFKSSLAPATSARDLDFLPATWHDRLLFPLLFAQNSYLVGEIPWRDLRLPLLYILLPVCLILRLLFVTSRNTVNSIAPFFATRYLLWAATLTYSTWLFLFAIYRYLLALEMLAPLLIVLALGLLPVRTQPRAVITVLVLLVVAVTIRPGNWGRKNGWLDRAVSIERPALKGHDLMILMAGFEPYSHVISEFPPEIPFIRVQSNFTSPDQQKGINTLIKERVHSHRGAYKLLIPDSQFPLAHDALGYFQLTFSPENCQAVRDDLSNTKLALCDVQRINPPVTP